MFVGEMLLPLGLRQPFKGQSPPGSVSSSPRPPEMSKQRKIQKIKNIINMGGTDGSVDGCMNSNADYIDFHSHNEIFEVQVEMRYVTPLPPPPTR